jgi:hypothetical protein
MRLGIRRGRDGMSLSSIRGLLLVTGQAPCGTGVIRARNAFMMRAAKLMATPGRYRRMVEDMRLTIAASLRIMMAQLSENITIEDVVQLLTADGITIPQVMDAFEWGRSMLLNLVSGMDASRRTEAMMALANAQQGMSQDDQDRPCPLEPRWWYPPQMTERPTESSIRADTLMQAPITQAMVIPAAPVRQAPGATQTIAPDAALIPSTAVAVTNDRWTGTQTIYLRPKKKKKKPWSKKKEEMDESSDIDNGGWMREREANWVARQQEQQGTQSEAQQEEGPSKETVEDEDEIME